MSFITNEGETFSQSLLFEEFGQLVFCATPWSGTMNLVCMMASGIKARLMRFDLTIPVPDKVF